MDDYEKAEYTVLKREELREITESQSLWAAQEAYGKTADRLTKVWGHLQTEYFIRDDKKMCWTLYFACMFLVLGPCGLFFISPKQNIYLACLCVGLTVGGVCCLMGLSYWVKQTRKNRIHILQKHDFDQYVVARAYAERLERELGIGKKEEERSVVK